MKTMKTITVKPVANPMIDSTTEARPSFLACGGSETAAELAATVQIYTVGHKKGIPFIITIALSTTTRNFWRMHTIGNLQQEDV